jgi:hypothetical protein
VRARNLVSTTRASKRASGAPVLSGEPGPKPELLCILLGSTKPLSAASIAEPHPSRAAYEQRYSAEADKVIAAGFVLEVNERLLGSCIRESAGGGS